MPVKFSTLLFLNIYSSFPHSFPQVFHRFSTITKYKVFNLLGYNLRPFDYLSTFSTITSIIYIYKVNNSKRKFSPLTVCLKRGILGETGG